MFINVGEERITSKRDLTSIFPKEFSNRLLINQFIQYILNNFFEQSNEKIVSGYIGEVVRPSEGDECYIVEPTLERQMNQLIPILKSGDDKITLNNYIANLHNDGCKVYDQNKLLSGKHWSWCPPIDVDMFTNFTNYYWIGWDRNELENLYIFDKKINVEDEIVGQKSYIYYYVDDKDQRTGETIKFYNGMRVCFINDTGKKYNHNTFVVSGLTPDDNGYLVLKPATMPLAILAKETNVVQDVIGKEQYAYSDPERDIEEFKFLTGFRFMLLNDANEEYNNKIYIVDGVGDSMVLVEDNYDPYLYDAADEDYQKHQAKADYFIMDRNCLDGNKWSRMNRWIHKSAIALLTIGSFESGASHGQLQHAAKPILCYNKDIELYNYGSYYRGNILTTSTKSPNELNSKDILEFRQAINDGLTENYILASDIVDGARILLVDVPSTSAQLFSIKLVNVSTTVLVTLNKIIDDRSPEGLSLEGDVVEVRKGTNAGKVLYFNSIAWVEAQEKNKVNVKPLFDLYDSDLVKLDNPVNYPESTFKGCTLFEYEEDTSIYAKNDPDLDMPIVYDASDVNYHFNNTIKMDEYKYQPLNDYEKTIEGYRFYKINGKEEYYNDWHISSTEDSQYLKTQSYITKTPVLETVDGKEYYQFKLDYSISKIDNKNTCIVSNNSVIIDKSYIIAEDKLVLIRKDQAKAGDLIIVKFLTNDDIFELKEDYCYEYPLSLVANQFNEDIENITYNELFDQMVDIITNQNDIMGYPSGTNNYSSIKHNVSVGTKIVQSVSSIIKSMILNDDERSSVRNAIKFVESAYIRFKKKFQNILDKMYLNGIITDDMEGKFSSDETSMDSYITDILNQINIANSGLKPFYNNGVTYLLENGYIPATPAYLGITNCYQPTIKIWEEFLSNNKPKIIIGHDGSYVKASNTVKDLILLRFEKLIYDSINPKFKDTKCGLNYHEFMPGKFRENTYSTAMVLNTYSQFFELWCSEHNMDYKDNLHFEYDSVKNPEAWKTWNYTGTIAKDGTTLKGSYRAVYMYYFDTYRPDTHPWEMLGFGDKPSWWVDNYGNAPYTYNNKIMWEDIANGYIADGEYKGYHKEYERKGLIENDLIPVDSSGKLKSLTECNIIENIPTIQNARKTWVVGDMGDLEFAYLQTSESKYDFEILKYFLRPVEWLETGWDTVNREVLFRGTTYEQVLDKQTNSREDISKIILHNEFINNEYVRKIGIQQWVSDYLLSNNLSISLYADKIRDSEVCLGYRCSGYYQKDTVVVSTDSYGVLPEENVHMSLIKSYNDGIKTYSGLVIQKTKKGYLVDGYDKTYPYFKVRLPEKYGKKSDVSESGYSVYYYHDWKETVVEIPYKKEFTSVQDVYDVIIGYGKYLEENERWYFNSRSPEGVVLDFRTSGESFLKWVSVLKGEESVGEVILLNPGILGLGNYNSGIVENMNRKIHGCPTILDIAGNPIEPKNMEMMRITFNTYFQPKYENLALIKIKTYDLEHLVTFDNKTIYNDVIYDSKYYTYIRRMNVYGIKVNKWYGTLYAPGYIVLNDGAIANYDKKAKDLRYIFDVDDVRCQGKYGEYSKAVVGYQKTKTYKDLYKNDKAMFDFYKGVIRDKGTKSSVAHMNRTRHVSSTGRQIELYEKWAFREGEFGHIKDNATIETILNAKEMIQNPQVITFESVVNNYYSQDKIYNAGDVVVLNNYEYICKYNTIYGEFNPDDWKQNRYIGNYIVYTDDKNWIKKPKNNSQIFKYSNNLLVNPIGGFAQITDCEYIVADEDELEQIREQMNIGETVWIVKTKDNDWDMRKKTGVNKFVSLRYYSLKDAIKQPEFDNVYHFVDDRKHYYTNRSERTSPVIRDDDIIYSDIDLNTQICKWCDIGKPEYTGNTGTYVFGKDYKVKLYNSVFVTQVEENNLNNGSPFKDIYGGPMITYSNMLLNMTQFGSTTYKYKWLMSLHVDTRAPGVAIMINDALYKEPNNNTVELVVCEGDIIRWQATALGCGIRSGEVEVKRVVTGYENIPNPTTQDKINYNIIQPLNITIPLSYRDGAVIFETKNPQSSSALPLCYNGKYEVKLVGAGGGAGGGSTKKHHKHGGGAGAGGSYLHGELTITGVDNQHQDKYYISCGQGGSGGIVGHSGGRSHGGNGGDSVIVQEVTVSGTKQGKTILRAQGGAGGCAARTHHQSYIDGRKTGSAGVNYIDPSVLEPTVRFVEASDSKNGNRGTWFCCEGKPGQSVYPSGTYGQGGNWRYKGNGYAGNNGYAAVIYRTNEAYGAIIKNNVEIIHREVLSTDSMEYSSYYQPYVVPPVDGKIQYFYSYDVLYDDGFRSDAKVINPGSKFYRYRSKSITAYHKPTVLKGDVWVDYSNKKYNIGDLVNVANNGTFKYYICENSVVATGTFSVSHEEQGETIIDWREYSPTYYYKIDCNYEAYDLYQPWWANQAYKVGDRIDMVDANEQHTFYICVHDHTSPSTFSTTMRIGDQDVVVWKVEEEFAKHTLYRGNWVASRAYSLNDTIKNNGSTYICVYAHTSPEEFSTTMTVAGETKTIWKPIKLSFVAGDTVIMDDVYYNSNVTQFYYGDWKTGTQYHVNDSIIQGGKFYVCTHAHTAPSTFSTTMEISGEQVTIWTENVWIVREPKKLNNGVPNFNYDGHVFNTELYEDPMCEMRVEKNNGSYVMTVDDLDLSRDYKVGSEYTLADPIGTYQDISPQYINEPIWYAINQVATYEIASGGLSYYVNSDKKSIVSDKESKVYSDMICSRQQMSIKQTITEDGIVYEDQPMLYVDLKDTVTDHLEPSYEMKDGDNFYYTSKSINELTDDTKLYSEFTLENEVGTYIEFVPVWETTDNLPNTYTNTVEYIDYTNNKPTIMDDNNERLDLFYTLDGNTFIPFINPSRCNLETGVITYNTSTDNKKITLYTLNKYTVETYDELASLTPSVNDIARVLESNKYYIYHTSTWNLIPYVGAEILTHDEYFKKKTSGVVKTLVDSSNTSLLYPELSYTSATFSQGSTITTGDSNENIKIYFNEQSVGKYVDSGNIIEETQLTGNVLMLIEDFTNDVMYNALVNMRNVKRQNPTLTFTQCYDKLVERNQIIEYTDKNQLVDLAQQYIIIDSDGTMTDKTSLYCTDSKVKNITCKIYNMYRNNDGQCVYTRLYRYGTEYYKLVNVFDDISNVSTDYAILVGDINSITTYNKVDYRYSTEKSYEVGDICEYEDIGLVCISPVSHSAFDENCWEQYSADKIVNVIMYKEKEDFIYITNDSYDTRSNSAINALSDTNNVSSLGGTLATSGKKGWMKLKYINEDYLFNLECMERLRVRTEDIKSCYIVDNKTNETLIQVQIFDPIQNIVPNNVLNEVNYISSIDPVNDYNDSGKWNDDKIGYLWWDTSKVRYVDYYQGDFEYRRTNWGKQLPGSEIAIMEWTKSYEQPTDGRRYVTRETYNYETSTMDTIYYYWEKNPVTIPNVVFRHNTAFSISKIINNPTTEGIVWMSPIDANITRNNENTLVLCNYNNAIGGQEAVLQINMDSDVDIQDHSEWVMVKENASSPVPDWLWEKMRDSLLEYKDVAGNRLPVPDPALPDSEKLGISFRPRQTVFNNTFNARRNFIDAINDIFASRTDEELNVDMNSGLSEVIDKPNPEEYYDVATTKLEMMSWKDDTLIGKNILVEHDETLDGIWVIYKIENDFEYTVVNYQRYNIQKYLTYKDWYIDDTIQYLTPIYTVSTESADAKALAETLEDLQMVKFEKDGEWELWQNREGTGTIVGKSNKIMYFSSYLYDYVNDDTLGTTKDYIITESGEQISEFDYVSNEIVYLLSVLFDYFGNV